MTRRRILILTQCYPPDVGGIERLMGGLAGAMAQAGHDVRVFADAARTERGLPSAEGPAVRRFGGLKPLRRQLKAWAAQEQLSRGGFDACFVDSWKSLERLSPPEGGPPIVALAHGMEFPAAPSAKKSSRIRNALAKAHAVAANSADTAARAGRFAPAQTPITIAHPPVEPLAPADPATAAALAHRLGGGGALIVSLARLEPRKGLDRVITALPHLPRARFAIAGDGGDRGRLQALATTLGVADRTIFLGKVSETEKSALLASADLFAMPARVEGDSVEGFGIVYLEAALAGLASLAGRAGGAGEAVVDGVTGLLCDGDDPGDVQAKLRALLGDPDMRAKLGAAGKARAEAEFGWAAGAVRYLRLAGL